MNKDNKKEVVENKVIVWLFLMYLIQQIIQLRPIQIPMSIRIRLRPQRPTITLPAIRITPRTQTRIILLLQMLIPIAIPILILL